MGFLGKQSRQQNVTSSNGLGDLLGNVLGGGQAETATKQQSLIESFLDSDGDGSILDDVAGMVLGGGKSSGGGGLGGLSRRALWKITSDKNQNQKPFQY